MEQQEQTNQATWLAPDAVNWLGTLQGFTDAGECSAYFAIADEMRGRPILDLGVGAGRTVTLLRALSPKYVAIDYLPVMVKSTRQRFPFVDARLGDARDLSDFDDESFSLVVFSYMGIDAVDHEGRKKILNEAHRVLEPGGIFWFSTLNLDGAAPRKRPWRPEVSSSGGLATSLLDAARAVKHAPREMLNYLRLSRFEHEGDGWMIAPFFAHAYGVLAHYTTLQHQIAELEEAGFRSDPDIFEDAQGARVAPSASSDAFCFNILARKR